MRSALLQQVQATPVRATPSYRFFFHTHRLAASLSGTFVAVFLLGTTAFAAQGALPGDVLYPVKIHLNEAVTEAVAVSDEAKATWNASVAEERVKEAEKLAVAGKLSSSTVAQLKSSFDNHAERVVALTRKVHEKDPEKSSKISEDFSASLDVHSDVLAGIGQPIDIQAVTAPAAKVMSATEIAPSVQVEDDASKSFSDHVRARAAEIRQDERQDRINDRGNEGEDERN